MFGEFSENKINTGRQNDLDIAKGLSILWFWSMFYLFHFILTILQVSHLNM